MTILNMLFIDGANDATLIGTGTFRNNLFNTTLGSALQVEGTTAQGGSLMVTRNTGASAGDLPFIALCKSRGSSLNSNTIVADNDLIGSLSFQGSDGTQFVEAASITAKIGDTPGANDMPGKLLFNITKNAEASGTEMMKIDAVGDVTVSTGNLVIGTSGKGISFAATSDGTTMSSELLDDYEEGSFTMTPNTGLAAHSSSTTANYTKIGRSVTVVCFFTVGSVASNSTEVTLALPFTNGAGVSNNSMVSIAGCYTSGVDVGDAGLVVRTTESSAVVSFLKTNDNAGGSTLLNSDLTANDDIAFTLTFFE